MPTPRLFLLVLALAALGAVSAYSATVAAEAALHLKPSADAPIVATLPAGASIAALPRDALAAAGIASLPAGWVATRYEGPVFGFARNESVAKDLTVKPASFVHAAPKPDAPLLSMVGDSDNAQVVELAGEWSKVVLQRSMILYLDSVALSPAAAMRSEALPAVEEAHAAPPQAAFVPPPSPPGPTAAPSGPGGQTIAHATPRAFQGYLMRTRRILWTGPRLDHQLVDEYGRRIALLDLSALLITEPLERFENRAVSVFGPVSRPADVKDLVIRVENLRLVP